MNKVRLGKTGLMVSRVGFGGIPIQRLSTEEAINVVRGVIAMGVNFIDTAYNYGDSEEKIGLAIKGIPRDELIIATKSSAPDKKTFLEHLDTSLKRLGTDYIDIHQHHNVSTLKNYEAIMAENGAYEGMMEAVRAGKVRFPAASSHSIDLAVKIIQDGKYMAIQAPFNFVDDKAAAKAIPLAKESDIGFIAMKPFGGGLLDDASTAIKYLMQFDNVVPDPGIEKLSEMEEIIRIIESGEQFNASDAETVDKMRAELGDHWCHKCDYCQPCPQNIRICVVLTLETFFKRMPIAHIVKTIGKLVENARNCTNCRVCMSRCPYNLNIPVLLKEKLALWDNYLTENVSK